MSPPTERFDTDELLAQLGWVRALARRVVSDPHGAEDLTQDTMLVALRGGASGAPAAGDGARSASLRRWLAAVVRNLGRTHRRSGERRARREVEAASRELSPSTLELVERASTHRELVGALIELDEPYRSTLLMRFFEGRSLREIAERTGVPISTVSTRIADGLARLRRRFVGRRTWLSSLVPLFRRPRELALPALTTGAVFVSIQAKLILVVVVVLVGGLIALDGLSGRAPARMEAAPRLGQPEPELVLATVPLAPARAPVAVEVPEPAVARSRAFHEIPEHAGLVHTLASVAGRVIDLDGTPIGGVEVCRVRPGGFFEGTGELIPAQRMGCVTADASGRFETEGALPFMLDVEDPHYTTLFEGVAQTWPDGDVADEALVIVAPRIPLAGLVVDEQGVPIADVLVSIQVDAARPGLDLTASRRVVPETRTDELGAFAFSDAPAVERSTLTLHAPGFAHEVLPVPPGGDPSLVVVMTRRTAGLYVIAGRVVLEDGGPAAGALVSTGVMASRTDEHGAFTIDFEPWLNWRVDEQAPTVLTAIQPGLLPASLTLPSVEQARESGWPDEIVLTLADRPFTLRGTVVDEHGEPVPGALIEPADASEFGLVPIDRGAGFSGVIETQEQVVGGGVARTDADGRFELSGLLDRDYTIRALTEPSLLTAVSEPVHASNQSVRIVLDGSRLGAVAGRVIDRHGSGLEGVRVSVSRKRISELMIGASALTDAAGAFRIQDVTTQPEYLRIEGAAIVPELFRELDSDADPSALELVVGRRCRVQFDWGDWPGREDQLVVVDDRGERLMMMRLRGNSIGEVPAVSFQPTVTDVIAVSDAAAHAIVLRDGAEVTRLRLDLSEDELNLVRL